MNIKLSVDTHCIKDTPKDKIPYSVISKSIGKNPCGLSLEGIAEVIENGYTISSPIYSNGEKKKENIIEMQLFILDFDGNRSSEFTYEDALKRAENYNLPVIISYETKSSVDWNRFRFIFLFDEPVHDVRLMNIINLLLLHVFPEADNTKDLSKMFLPGRNVRLHSRKPFYFDTLVVAARDFCLSKAKSTWVNLLKKFNSQYGLVTKGTDIFTGDEITLSNFGTLTFQSIYINMECNAKVPKSSLGKYIYFHEAAHNPPKIISENSKSSFQLRDKSVLTSNCKLMSKFVNGRRLPHEEWFGLASNLIHIKGGQKLFADIISRYGDIYDNVPFKIKQVEYSARMNYNPYNCESFCPYSEECSHEANLILTLRNRHRKMKRIAGYSEKYAELSEVREKMRRFFRDAIYNISSVNVLKAPTGSGKSTAHLNFLKESDLYTINAYPNAHLMREKYYEALSMGIDAYCTPTIDDLYPNLTEKQESEIKSMYEIGAGGIPTKLLKEWSKDNAYIRDYLNALENIPHKGNIFTTHARLLQMPCDIMSGAVVFIDEDIVPMMISCSAVTVDEFRRLFNAVRDVPIKNKLMEIGNNILGNSHYFSLDKMEFPVEFKIQTMNFFSEMNIGFSQNIWGLIESGNYYYHATSECVYFTVRNDINRAGKIIMMSATANEEICRKAFGGLVNFCDLGQIKYKGKVVIHANKSCSRNYLSANDAEKIIRDIVAKHGDCAYITFKEYAQFISNEFPRTHYGQAIGTNDFEGKNLVVIGLNHRPFYVYELFGRELGIYDSDTLSMRKTTLYGFEFYMMTYAKPGLRNIQQYMISSDLEQAIGRARLIYHDCTVHLYGNFPARQGILDSEMIPK